MDKSPDRFFTHWDADGKVYALQLHFKRPGPGGPGGMGGPPPPPPPPVRGFRVAFWARFLLQDDRGVRTIARGVVWWPVTVGLNSRRLSVCVPDAGRGAAARDAAAAAAAGDDAAAHAAASAHARLLSCADGCRVAEGAWSSVPRQRWILCGPHRRAATSLCLRWGLSRRAAGAEFRVFGSARRGEDGMPVWQGTMHRAAVLVTRKKAGNGGAAGSKMEYHHMLMTDACYEGI